MALIRTSLAVLALAIAPAIAHAQSPTPDPGPAPALAPAPTLWLMLALSLAAVTVIADRAWFFLREQPPRVRPAPQVVRAEAPKEAPPTELPPGSAAPAPVFGVTMSSVSQAGKGPTVPVGNTTQPGPTGPAELRPAPAPAAAVEVTRMPMPQGRCTGAYTEAARAAGVEGVVVLDLIVDETGRARDISVVSGLGHGLTEAAITALRQCRFTPGEKAGAPVAVRVRGFKIRFLMDEVR